MSDDDTLSKMLQDADTWEEAYRKKHCTGKTDAQLEKEGWWRDYLGDWYCDKMARARERKFKPRFMDWILKAVLRRQRKMETTDDVREGEVNLRTPPSKAKVI